MSKWSEFWSPKWQDFYMEEKRSRDAIDVKCAYIDMAGDLAAGVLLSQIVYWNLPNEEWKSKLRVRKDGKFWLAKKRSAWWEEIRLKPRQVDRAMAILEEKGLVETFLFKFNGAPTTHIRLTDKFLQEWQLLHQKQVEKLSNSPIG